MPGGPYVGEHRGAALAPYLPCQSWAGSGAGPGSVGCVATVHWLVPNLALEEGFSQCPSSAPKMHRVVWVRRFQPGPRTSGTLPRDTEGGQDGTGGLLWGHR